MDISLWTWQPEQHPRGGHRQRFLDTALAWIESWWSQPAYVRAR